LGNGDVEEKEKALLVAGAAVVFTSLGSLGVSVDARAVEDHFRPKESVAFSKAACKKTQVRQPDRYEMANDLVRSRRLIGATAESVRDTFWGHRFT